MAGNKDNVEVEVNDGCIRLTDRLSDNIWQYILLFQIHQKLKKVV